MATTMFENFRPLVELMVITPDGDLIARMAANEELFDRFPKARTGYSEELQDFLSEFLANAHQGKAPTSP